MKTDKSKVIVQAAFELMESEEREQGFQRHEFLAEILIYTDAAKLDPDSRQLHGMIDDVLDKECITVDCRDVQSGWRYYGKKRASVENIERAAHSRIAHGQKIMTGAVRNGAKQEAVSELVAGGMGYFEAESLINRTFGRAD